MAELQPFGRSMRKNFLFSDSYNPLNHGSYGTWPQAVETQLQNFRAQQEQRPDKFIRSAIAPLLEKSRAATAQLVNADPSEIVLVPNASVASNTILRSLVWQEGDILLHFDTRSKIKVYPANASLVGHLEETTPLKVESVPVHWPAEDDELVNAFEGAIVRLNGEGEGSRRRKVKAALFDTVSSMPGLRLPWERLVAACKKHGVLSIVDGAHGAGMIPLDLHKGDPDFFFTNLHKWLFVPRGCAALYVPLRNQHLIRTTLPTSLIWNPLPGGKGGVSPHPIGSGKNQFVDMHQFVATTDNNNFFCVPAALAFRQEVCGGEERILQHLLKQAREGGDRAAAILDTEVMDNAAGTLRNCAFANIRLPLRYEGDVQPDWPLRNWIMDRVLDADMYLFMLIYNGALWWRLSSQIYIEMEDIEAGAELLLEICKRVQAGEHLTTKPAGDAGPVQNELPIREAQEASKD